MSVIPDPEKPTKLAIDTETGRLLAGVHMLPIEFVKDVNAPTVAELNAGVHVGWTKGFDAPEDPFVAEPI